MRNVRNLAFIGLNAHKNPRKNNGRKNKNVEPRGIGDALVEVEKTLHENQGVGSICVGFGGSHIQYSKRVASSSQGAYIIILLFSSWAYYNNPITAPYGYDYPIISRFIFS